MALSLTSINLSWKLMIITAALFQASLTWAASSTSNNLSVAITSNATDGIICYNKSIELTCQANGVNVTTYKWTSTEFRQIADTASITVMATDDPVQYTCTVTDVNGDNGNSSVNISSNAAPPVLYQVNFNADKIVIVGSLVNLTVQVISNLSPTNKSTWSRKNANLPKDSLTANYSQDGNNYTSLIIHKASYANDGGLYYLNTSNHCGPSSTSVDLYIDKKDVECFPSGYPVPLISSSNNQTTVEGEVIEYKCVFRGNYSPSNYGSVYWIITLQNGTKINIFDYSDFSDYLICTNRSCPHGDYACCRFTTKLRIVHTTLSLNNAMITCVVIYDSASSFNTSSLMVIERPILTRGPTDAISITEYESIHFECHFNSSLIKYLAICEWLKDEDPVSHGDKWQTTEPGFENHLICGFNISSASVDDEGNYSCYCYYNESFREQLNIPKNVEIRSQFGKAVLQVEIDNHQSTSGEQKEIIALCVVASTMATLIFTLVTWRVVKYRRGRSDTADNDDNRVETGDRNPNNELHYPHYPIADNHSDESGDSSTDESTISLKSAQSQPEPSMEFQPTDNISVLTNTGTSEGSMNFPTQQEGDGHSATVETLTHRVSVLAGNIQIRDTGDLADASILKITEQPIDQKIQFKNNKEEVVYLTCYAESLEGNDLCYEWYSRDSSDVISDNRCAKITLKRPSRNIKKQYYCKVSVANQPEHYVISGRAEIKLEIIWFTEQPGENITVIAGENLELSCIAKTARRMEVKYSWFKCSKKGINKTPTHHEESRMIVPVCSDSNDNHYLCEAAVVKRGTYTVLDRINSRVARIEVVNSTKISIIKQPNPEIFAIIGEKLSLECKATCAQHPVKYQWHHNEEPLAGATQSTLTIQTVYDGNTGSYYCKVTSNYSKDTVKSQTTHVRMKDTSWNKSQRSQVQAEQFLMHRNRIYAKDKLALLIGNSDYKERPLRCPKNDVKAVTERLQQLNFKTITLVDLTLSQMTNAVNYFCSLLDTGMYAVFYYSGHGVEVNKTTYFVPIDADDKELKIVQCKNSDLITYKLQGTRAKIIMCLDCCRKLLPRGSEMPTEQFSEYSSANTICKIFACASSFETFEMRDGKYSFMTKALLHALSRPGKKWLKNELYEYINEYYTNYNVSASEGKQLIRPRMMYGLTKDLSLEDPIRPYSKARDLLLTLPKTDCYLDFNHPIMKSSYESIRLCFEALYSNVLVFHVYCDAAKQPILKDVKLLHNSGLFLTKLKSEGIASYEISNLLVLTDIYERGEHGPKIQLMFQMPQDATVMDEIEYEIPSDLINLKFCC